MPYRLAGLICFGALLLSTGCQNKGGGDAHSESLTGTVTVNGQPIPSTTMVVTSADGKSSGGMTNESGVYLIPSPPKGKLEFHFVVPDPKSPVPVKYRKPGNGLSFEYTGGKQKYDIDLK